MPTRGELRAELQSLAAKFMIAKRACVNEESTKLFLVLPVLGALGYDFSNPDEVSLEHPADFADSNRKVDVVVNVDGEPTIAVECKRVGADLDSFRGQLRGYFNALRSVKVGVLTNGMQYEWFIDSDEPNIMDEDPFLTVDLAQVADHGLSDEMLDTLLLLRKDALDPRTIAETAHTALVRKRLRMVLLEEARSPSIDFCRLMIERIGIRRKKDTTIDRVYGPIVKAAFEESLVAPVAQHLGLRLKEGAEKPDGSAGLGNRIITTERELVLMKYIRRRLAFLLDDERQFDAIDEIRFKDYIGKLVVFLAREQKGWLFDYKEGQDGVDTFIFPDPIGKIVTADLRDLDVPLKATFLTRLREMSPAVPASKRVAVG